MNYNKEQHTTIAKFIRDSGYQPNPREEQFLNSIKNLSRLSEKQSEWLTGIYTKSAGGGTFQRKEYIGAKR
jgi:hypothetical protein